MWLATGPFVLLLEPACSLFVAYTPTTVAHAAESAVLRSVGALAHALVQLAIAAFAISFSVTFAAFFLAFCFANGRNHVCRIHVVWVLVGGVLLGHCCYEFCASLSKVFHGVAVLVDLVLKVSGG